MPDLTLHPDHFLFDGQPFRILSGAMHYFRIHPACWDDRLHKLRMMGCNTLETYLPWNLHEPRPGQFDFGGPLDVAAYVHKAAEHGLYVILRPGPYICAEWELGGLPAWLLADPALRLRSTNPAYLQAVDRYLDALAPRLVPLMASQGGPVIAVQVENEYGSYGNDKAYLRHLAGGLRRRGLDCLLFTSDGWGGQALDAGTLPEVYKTVNFGSKPDEAFTRLRQFQTGAPLMCTEFWCGWFDHWGGQHHTRTAEDAAAVLDAMLAAGASVNFYMFHGGSNFGFMNGANVEGEVYTPTVTSYDYDAPLDESGESGAKFYAFRQVIGKYAPLPPLTLPPPAPRLEAGPLALDERLSLFDALRLLSTAHRSATPLPMEHLGQSYGYILYRTGLPGLQPGAVLTLYGLRDRAQVFLDCQPAGVLERGAGGPATLDLPPGGGESVQLDILVENQGRVNFGPYLLDRKGLLGDAWLGVRAGETVRALNALFGWEIYPLPLDDGAALGRLPFMRLPPQVVSEASTGPAFYRGHFDVAQPADTFLALPGWTKGVAFINGFNLGRYWALGPQRTLYVPAPVLCSGENELLVFEQHHANSLLAELRAAPLLGKAV